VEINMEELISVIVPVYNTEQYLDRCIKSVVNQTYKNLEIILINDDSIDDSINILEKWKNKDNRIIVINKKHEGLSETRNVGIEKSTGKYISFVDSDDEIDLDMYEKLVSNFNNDVDMVYCDFRRKKNGTANEDLKVQEISKEEKIYEVFPFKGFVWLALYRKDIIDSNNVKFYKKNFTFEDVLFSIDYILCCTKKIVNIKEKLYVYYNNPQGIMSKVKYTKDFSKLYNNFIAIKDYYYKLITIDNLDKKIIANLYTNYIYNLYLNTKNIPFYKEINLELKKNEKYFNKKQKIYLKIANKKPNILYYFNNIIIRIIKRSKV
jgi:glycosyltransferase involved in cell wall biosynthesis